MSGDEEQLQRLETRVAALEQYVMDLFMVACAETDQRLKALIASREISGQQ